MHRSVLCWCSSLPRLLPMFDKRRQRVPPLLPCLQDSVVALDIVTDERKANCKVRPDLNFLLGQVRRVSREMRHLRC